MKARNKITGKEITILGISKEYGTVSYFADGVLYQENFASGALEIIDDSDPVDWSSFRREAAKDVLCAIIGHKDSGIGSFAFDVEAKITKALSITDILIEKLKQE